MAFNVVIKGLALMDQGLAGEFDDVLLSGTALNTNGFLWEASNIWTVCCDDITTVWTEVDCC